MRIMKHDIANTFITRGLTYKINSTGATGNAMKYWGMGYIDLLSVVKLLLIKKNLWPLHCVSQVNSQI